MSERRITPQGSTKELSAAVLEKRRRRKQERDRKKRKRRELRAKEKSAKALEGAEATEPDPPVPGQETQAQPGLLFNKVSAVPLGCARPVLPSGRREGALGRGRRPPSRTRRCPGRRRRPSRGCSSTR